MTTTDMTPVTFDGVELGRQLVKSAKNPRHLAVTQALVEERTILAQKNVRRALLVEHGGRPRCHWEGLSGRLYQLGLDDAQRAFLELVLGMVGIGLTTLGAVELLDQRRLLILQRAIVTLSGIDTIAVGTRL
ncbi:hypothetical protein [Streptomyces sp. NPDC001978]|uniref:hypothetical protein n=1 Tax=Streptomyces sp. NPDC001978 TaxID=3364627 RepID=UPI003677F4C8